MICFVWLNQQISFSRSTHSLIIYILNFRQFIPYLCREEEPQISKEQRHKTKVFTLNAYLATNAKGKPEELTVSFHSSGKEQQR